MPVVINSTSLHCASKLLLRVTIVLGWHQVAWPSHVLALSRHLHCFAELQLSRLSTSYV